MEELGHKRTGNNHQSVYTIEFHYDAMSREKCCEAKESDTSIYVWYAGDRCATIHRMIYPNKFDFSADLAITDSIRSVKTISYSGHAPSSNIFRVGEWYMLNSTSDQPEESILAVERTIRKMSKGKYTFIPWSENNDEFDLVRIMSKWEIFNSLKRVIADEDVLHGCRSTITHVWEESGEVIKGNPIRLLVTIEHPMLEGRGLSTCMYVTHKTLSAGNDAVLDCALKHIGLKEVTCRNEQPVDRPIRMKEFIQTGGRFNYRVVK